MGLVRSLKNPGGLAACPSPQEAGAVPEQEGALSRAPPPPTPRACQHAYSLSWGGGGGWAVWLQQVPLAALSPSTHPSARSATQAPRCGPGDTASRGTPTRLQKANRPTDKLSPSSALRTPTDFPGTLPLIQGVGGTEPPSPGPGGGQAPSFPHLSPQDPAPKAQPDILQRALST